MRRLEGANGIGANATGALASKVIYFDFDKSEIKPEFADLVAAHARNSDRPSEPQDEARGQHR